MKNKIIFILFFSLLLSCTNLFASNSKSISITGTVKQPLNLSIEDICRYKTVRIQLNEILKDGSYRGAWFYNGVPLRALLETAYIEKEESAFKKTIDSSSLTITASSLIITLSSSSSSSCCHHHIIITLSSQHQLRQ